MCSVHVHVCVWVCSVSLCVCMCIRCVPLCMCVCVRVCTLVYMQVCVHMSACSVRTNLCERHVSICRRLGRKYNHVLSHFPSFLRCDIDKKGRGCSGSPPGTARPFPEPWHLQAKVCRTHSSRASVSPPVTWGFQVKVQNDPCLLPGITQCSLLPLSRVQWENACLPLKPCLHQRLRNLLSEQ